MARSPYGNYGYAILTAGALRTPDRVALTYCGERSFTYDQLNRVVNRRAHALLDAGIGAGTRVAALLNETLGVAEVYLAQAKIGAITAALNPYWPVETLQAVVAASGCTAFVYDATVEQVVERIRPELPGITTWLRASDLDHDDDSEPTPGAHFDDPVALYYTSGTTGLPKAVVHTHASSLATAQIWLDVPRSADSVFGTGAIIWGIGFPAIVGPALYAGMRLVLEQDWGPENFLTVVPREKVTHVSQIPSFYAALLGSAEHEGVDLSSLEVIMLGGEPLTASMLARIKERLPAAGVYSYYGQTEAPYTCMGRVDDGSTPLGASGRARTGNAVLITGPGGERLVGETGEINLAGPHRMAGYDGEPGKGLRGEWYVGGDLGTLSPDGVLQAIGRREDAIAKGGSFTQPATIEEAATALDAVAEAGAVGVPEGAAEQKILLAVVARAGHSLDAGKVALALADTLPGHQRPDHIVVADELPHFQDASGGPGKLLRREIRATYGHLVG
ncbi:acyl--CoA ligase [Nonomuraea sp. NBC_01738]|uniref:class I adenylate-forming enzyme family protein n=1 Tax=Nonomuraea sp. NBC_01738 TaxID=2976003 RepID=UPI002E12463E|nr:acyl--CoA ligase [Nonomuraea sp. NBC_01738]